MRERDVGVNVHYIPIYHFSYYQEHFNFNPNDFPATEEVFSKIVTLPLFPKMTKNEVEEVIGRVNKVIDYHSKKSKVLLYCKDLGRYGEI